MEIYYHYYTISCICRALCYIAIQYTNILYQCFIMFIYSRLELALNNMNPSMPAQVHQDPNQAQR